MRKYYTTNQDSPVHQTLQNSLSATISPEPLINSPTPPVKPKKSIMIKILLLVLIGMTVAVGSRYTWTQISKQQISNVVPNSIQSTTIPTQQTTTFSPTSPTPTLPQTKIGNLTPINNTQNLYKNEKYEFEIYLPENFYITQEGFLENENDSSVAFFVDLSTIKPENVPGREFNGIRIIARNFSGNLFEYVKEKSKTELRDHDPVNSPEVTITETQIDGILAYKVFNNYYVLKNGKLYSINNGVNETLFNQILSTLKFL